MPSVRIDLNRDGIRALLADGDTQRMIESRAEAVANAARSKGIVVGEWSGGGGTPLPIEVVNAGNSKRARALVVADHEAGLAVESKHRLLVSSLDAAR